METISIGIKKTVANDLVKNLNRLLANYQVYYQNLRGFHWTVKGPLFFELHIKFEEWYNDAVLKIDEIAERILTLEGAPLHSFSAYLQNATIKPSENAAEATLMVKIVQENLNEILLAERTILLLASNAGDDGTASMLSEYIQQQEKMIWMLRSYLA